MNSIRSAPARRFRRSTPSFRRSTSDRIRFIIGSVPGSSLQAFSCRKDLATFAYLPTKHGVRRFPETTCGDLRPIAELRGRAHFSLVLSQHLRMASPQSGAAAPEARAKSRLTRRQRRPVHYHARIFHHLTSLLEELLKVPASFAISSQIELRAFGEL